MQYYLHAATLFWELYDQIKHKEELREFTDIKILLKLTLDTLQPNPPPKILINKKKYVNIHEKLQ